MSDNHEHHVVPLWQLIAVFVALLFLTVVTVAVAKVDLGQFNLTVALLIALVKALVVAAFFMHLWWDAPFNTIALVSGVLFVGLFVALSILDVGATKDRVDNFLAEDNAIKVDSPRRIDQRINIMNQNAEKHHHDHKDAKPH